MVDCRCCCSDKKDVRVSFCPECKSRSVGYVFGFGNLFGVVPKMRCRDCGYNASVFPVLIADEEALKRAVGEIKKRHRVAKKKVVKKVKKVAKKKKVVRKKK